MRQIYLLVCTSLSRSITLVLFLVISLFANQLFTQCGYMCNTNFENNIITSATIPFSQTLAPNVPCWNTTATDNRIEVWRSGFMGVPSYSGSQFVELNATQVSTLYQDFSISPGTKITINFAHRGRNGVDAMEVRIRQIPGSVVSLGTFSDGNSAWRYYSLSYTIPAGITNYRLEFASISSSGSTGPSSVGNFLDAISITATGIVPDFGINSASQPLATNNFVFTNTTTGGSTYLWSFGDGTTSTAFNPPAKTYAAEGSYVVKLFVTSASGCIDSILKIVTVSSFTCTGGNLLCNTDFESPVIAPSATYTYVSDPDVPCWQTTDNSGMLEFWTTSPYSGSQYIELNADEMDTIYQDFIVTPGTKLNVSFAHRGRYNVETMGVEIGPIGGPYTSLGAFSDGPTAWNFYMGLTYIVPFGLGNNYRIMLTHISNGGEPWPFGNLVDALTVVPVLATATISNFDVNNSPQCLTSNSFIFTNYSTVNGAATYAWDFGDGTTSASANPPAKTYAAAGTYNVTLTVTSAACTDTRTISVTVTKGVTPNFSFDATPQCLSGNNFIFTNTSSLADSGAYSSTWSLIDNNKGNLPSLLGLGEGELTATTFIENNAAHAGSIVSESYNAGWMTIDKSTTGNWPSTLNVNSYVQFRMMNASGASENITVENISVEAREANGESSNIVADVRYSLDGGTTFIALTPVTNFPAYASPATISLTPSTVPILTDGSEIIVRIYFYSTVSNDNKNNSVEIRNVKITGDVARDLLYIWDFGDGNTLSTYSRNANQSHSYAAIGNYPVNLTVITEDVCAYSSNITKTASVINCVALPVELITFTGWKDNAINILTWTTSSEYNNDYFILERSLNGIDFEPTKTIQGKGNSNTRESYYYNDEELLNRTCYYRLKQVDNNGSYSYSKIVTIQDDTKGSIHIYPNPNHGAFTIHYLGADQAYKLDIMDAKGRVVYVSSGDSMGRSIEVKDLAPGLYTVQVHCNDNLIVEKLLVY